MILQDALDAGSRPADADGRDDRWLSIVPADSDHVPLERIGAASMPEDRPLRQALNTLAHIVVDSTDTVACSIHLLDTNQRLRTAGGYGLSNALIRGMDAARGPRVRHPAVDAIESHDRVLVDNLREQLLDDPQYHRVHSLLRNADWSPIVCLPLFGRTEALGAVCYYFDRHQWAGETADTSFLKALADLAATVVQNAQLLAAAREEAALEERQRLARELHDSVSQALYGIALGSQTALEMLNRDSGSVREPLEYVLQLADVGLAEIRALILELRPELLEMEGVAGALSKAAETVRTRHGIAVETFFDDIPVTHVDVQQALYRIGQEALHNSVRHAGARHLEIRLTTVGSTIALDVIDDGIGFRPDDPFPGHLGLRSMRERALAVGGSLDVTSNPGGGTHVMARVPRKGSVSAGRS
jgi:signal transduction histidine kinase